MEALFSGLLDQGLLTPPRPSFFLPSLSAGPQGDGNIRYYEISTEKPYLSYLMEFRSPAPQKGLGKGAPGPPWLLH